MTPINRNAVCMLLINEDGKVLAITRTKLVDGERVADRDNWGLPGGKVDVNESLSVAVIRETFEETGYVVADPQPVFAAYVESGKPHGKPFFATTFIGHKVGETPDAPRSHPFEGDVEWKWPFELVEGPYRKYNKALFEAVQLPLAIDRVIEETEA